MIEKPQPTSHQIWIVAPDPLKAKLVEAIFRTTNYDVELLRSAEEAKIRLTTSPHPECIIQFATLATTFRFAIPEEQILPFSTDGPSILILSPPCPWEAPPFYIYTHPPYTLHLTEPFSAQELLLAIERILSVPGGTPLPSGSPLP